MSTLINGLNQSNNSDPNNNIFDILWGEYEKVILRSLITSFGLDFIVKDQYGGDVDTINNVRKIDSDVNMKYKNTSNEKKYYSQEKYSTELYHTDKNFREIKKQAREAFDVKKTMLDDAYVPDNKLIPRNNNTIDRVHQGQLDHVISAHEIHEDRGRVLSGKSGVELANNESNLRFTNAHLNLNKSDMTVEEYIEMCEKNPEKVNWNGNKGEPLPEEVKERLRSEYERSKKEYDSQINHAYYTSSAFWSDTALAATKRGVEMGIRQALGLIIVEIWFVVKDELKQIPADCEMKDIFEIVGKAIKLSADKIKEKYKDIFDKFGEGFLAGLTASLTTTLCNIFFTTSKNMVRCIRQLYASVIEASKVLLINPDNLYFGDRIKSTCIILATGASVLIGTSVGDMISKTPIGALPEVGNIVQVFCSSLVCGIISCSLLVFMDRSKVMNYLVYELNKIPSEVTNYVEIARAFERLAAKLENIDIDKFKEDIYQYELAAEEIGNTDSEEQLENILTRVIEKFNISLPWDGNFDDFMGNKNNTLNFS